MKIKTYFCNIDNFGDALNKYIYDKCFGVKVIHANSWEASYAGIGSILDHLLFQTKDIFKVFKNILNINKQITLMSCGFARENEYYLKKPRFFKRMVFKRKIKVLSLRGELTKEQVSKIDNKIDLSDIALGDMGLLASYLLDKKEEKKYSLGICPHYDDISNPIFKQIQEEYPNSIILNTKDDPIEFLKKVAQCETIISTGLHPLIVADSLGIPNLWCRISEKTTTRHKYYDYYSVFGIKVEPVNLFENKISPEMIKANYKVDYQKKEEVKQKLFNHHKKYFDNLLSNAGEKND